MTTQVQEVRADTVAKYQQQLLEQARQIYYQTPLSDAAVKAYLATPRHLFVWQYREWSNKEWYEVHEENLPEHLATLYADRPLTLFGDDDDNVLSTISQPSFVLRMLDLLELEPGHRGDNLFVLRKVQDHFESTYSMPCAFVQLTGKNKIESLDPIVLDAQPEWAQLQHAEIARRPFWWSGKGPEGFMWQTMGIRSFLGIAEPSFRAFKTPRTEANAREGHYFGLWDRDSGSLVLAKDDELISYGNAKATERLLHVVHQWVDLGMPTAASFTLHVYGTERPLVARRKQWVVKRSESQFLWSLESS
jgi:hypothetical protein